MNNPKERDKIAAAIELLIMIGSFGMIRPSQPPPPPPPGTSPVVVTISSNPNPSTVGSPVNFHVDASGGIPPYNFYYIGYGDGGQSVGQDTTYAYSRTGIFQVNAKVRDSTGMAFNGYLTQSVNSSGPSPCNLSITDVHFTQSGNYWLLVFSATGGMPGGRAIGGFKGPAPYVGGSGGWLGYFDAAGNFTKFFTLVGLGIGTPLPQGEWTVFLSSNQCQARGTITS